MKPVAYKHLKSTCDNFGHQVIIKACNCKLCRDKRAEAAGDGLRYNYVKKYRRLASKLGRRINKAVTKAALDEM